MAASVAASAAPSTAAPAERRVVSLSGLRGAIARNMAQGWQAPRVAHSVDVDLSRVEALRTERAAAGAALHQLAVGARRPCRLAVQRRLGAAEHDAGCGIGPYPHAWNRDRRCKLAAVPGLLGAGAGDGQRGAGGHRAARRARDGSGGEGGGRHQSNSACSSRRTSSPRKSAAG